MPITTRILPKPFILESKNTAVTSQTGMITVGTTAYHFPVNDGGAGASLQTDGQGILRWVAASTVAIPMFTPVTVTSSEYFINTIDNFIRYAGTLDGLMHLPLAAANPGKQIIIVNLTQNKLTIIGSSIDNLDGDTSPIVLDSQFNSVALTSDGGGNWVII